MTEQRRTALKELQKLDLQIQLARQAIEDFDPLFEQVEEPALVLESELETSRKRLQELKLESSRLELSVEEKRDRQKRLDERLLSVRNLREEAAVSAELEMVKRALQGDEQEALTVIDQTRKTEERVAEVEAAFAEATAIVEPKKQELLDQREAARNELASLQSEREAFVGGMEASELKIYDAIRAGGRRVAVSELTGDGACGNCFGMVPLQLQNEVRHGTSLIRCEGCGVILAAPEPEPEGGAEAADEAAPAADGDPDVAAAADEDATDGAGAADDEADAEADLAEVSASDDGAEGDTDKE